MQLLWVLCASMIDLGLHGSVIATTEADFNGYLKIYSAPNYKSAIITVNFNYASRCYSFDCDSLDNKAASAKWSKLPRSKSNTLIFYTGFHCTGRRLTIHLSNTTGVLDFTGIRRKVLSFMVKTVATTSAAIAKRGKSNICNWKRVGTGDIAEEDPTIAVFF
ncbi:unnamed protein product [Phytophthora fragariaefolia]|uniref:Unnamed protein product n=1 Tax=Phytophthora fragariaefolia TaxID=1490495 RepID=A0A9W7D7H9_9STRA|nr:unnamed protein product [Phytophthora fragariaefolia]